MSPEEVDDYARSLPGCKRKGSEAHPAWYVRDRLVARLIDPTTLLVRVPRDQRDALVDRFPAHHKVEAYLEHADAAAVTEAIQLAWEFQQSW